jgi:hypothetical protein
MIWATKSPPRSWKSERNAAIRHRSITLDLTGTDPISYKRFTPGRLAQLARAPARHAGGQRFKSSIAHSQRDAAQRLLTGKPGRKFAPERCCSLGNGSIPSHLNRGLSYPMSGLVRSPFRRTICCSSRNQRFDNRSSTAIGAGPLAPTAGERKTWLQVLREPWIARCWSARASSRPC